MAQEANTYHTYDAKGKREDLTDILSRITPTDKPFLSAIGTSSASAILHEWQTDTLATASNTNKAVEGDDAAYVAVQATKRMSNYTQISTKAVVVSGTMQAVETAGRDNELTYQVSKSGDELMRDIEATLTNEQAAAVGSSSVARASAGFEAWIRTNDSRGTSGADPTLSSSTQGYPNAAPTDGTQRNISESLIKSVLQQVYSSGGNARFLFPGPVNKVNISSQVLAGGGSANRFMPVQGQVDDIWAAFDVYHGDFGLVRVVPDRFSRERSILVVDPSHWSIAYLRRVQTEEMAKTGDADKRLMLAEYTLRCNNEASSGVIADLNTTII